MEAPNKACHQDQAWLVESCNSSALYYGQHDSRSVFSTQVDSLLRNLDLCGLRERRSRIQAANQNSDSDIIDQRIALPAPHLTRKGISNATFCRRSHSFSKRGLS